VRHLHGIFNFFIVIPEILAPLGFGELLERVLTPRMDAGALPWAKTEHPRLARTPPIDTGRQFLVQAERLRKAG